MSARILDLAAGGSRLARMCTAAFSWARRGPVTIPGRAGLGPDDVMPPLADRVARVEALGRVLVTVDPDFIPRECGWCHPDRPEVTSLRVWGQPRPDVLADRPLLVVAVCLRCALGSPACGGRRTVIGAIGQAHSESFPSTVIRIEVCE